MARKVVDKSRLAEMKQVLRRDEVQEGPNKLTSMGSVSVSLETLPFISVERRTDSSLTIIAHGGGKVTFTREDAYDFSYGTVKNVADVLKVLATSEK